MFRKSNLVVHSNKGATPFSPSRGKVTSFKSLAHSVEDQYIRETGSPQKSSSPHFGHRGY